MAHHVHRPAWPVPPRVLEARTAFFTPTVAATIRQIDNGLPSACQQIPFAVDYVEHGVIDPYTYTGSRSSGFAHEYRPLTPDERTAVLTQRLPITSTNPDPIAHTTAIATIVRITGGNFRLVDRLITPEAVDATRESLLIGH